MNEEFIVHCYIDSKMSIVEIGNLFGVSFYTIKKILVSNNVVIRNPGPVEGKVRGNFEMLVGE